MAKDALEYMYSSARIKAKEGAQGYEERLNSYLSCKSISQLCYLLMPGEEISHREKREAVEKYFANKVSNALSLIQEIAPEPRYFDFLLYEYDCCNLKTLIKCQIKGIDSDGMLYEYSSVSSDLLKEALEKRSFDGVMPRNMARTATEAIDAFARTKDPKVIDLVLDRACFADMLENAKLCGNKIAEGLVKARIDSINIMTSKRISLSEIADKVSIFDMAFIEGGALEKKLFLPMLEGEDKRLSDVLFGTDYNFDSIDKMTLSSLEKALDERYLSIAREAKYVPFGFEVLCSYIVNTIFEAKNARIISASLASGMSEEEIRERVRF